MAPTLIWTGNFTSSILQTVWNHWTANLIKSLKVLKALLYNICQNDGIFQRVAIILIVTFLIGMTEGDSFWETLRDQVLGKPSEEIKECHKPKPVLLQTGEVMYLDYHGEISILLFLNLWIIRYE